MCQPFGPRFWLCADPAPTRGGLFTSGASRLSLPWCNRWTPSEARASLANSRIAMQEEARLAEMLMRQETPRLPRLESEV